MEVSEKDVKDASGAVLKDLKRFQSDKEEDLRKYMVSLIFNPSRGYKMLMCIFLDGFRTLPYRVGATQLGNMGRGSGGSQQDSRVRAEVITSSSETRTIDI